MLSDKQILEIREHLESAKNPIFYYDNDADGLCSYILLRRFVERGKGVAVRSHPDVDESYARKAQELGADYVFVLDRPVLGVRFVEEIQKLGLPIVWIDHHEVEDKEKYKDVFIYNPTHSKGKSRSEEPVCYWAYMISNKVEDMWISLMGCIADHYLPDFSKEFAKQYGEYWGKGIKGPFDAYYGVELGRLARVLGYALKDSITHVVQLQNFLIKCKTPGEFFDELEGNKPFAKKYKEISTRQKALLEKAKREFDEKKKMLFFSYGGDMSISSDIANELSYLYPKKNIGVAYSTGPLTNISLRGKKVRTALLNVLKKGYENSSGGGHEEAVGARIQTSDLEKFKSDLENEL